MKKGDVSTAKTVESRSRSQRNVLTVASLRARANVDLTVLSAGIRSCSLSRTRRVEPRSVTGTRGPGYTRRAHVLIPELRHGRPLISVRLDKAWHKVKNRYQGGVSASGFSCLRKICALGHIPEDSVRTLEGDRLVKERIQDAVLSYRKLSAEQIFSAVDRLYRAFRLRPRPVLRMLGGMLRDRDLFRRRVREGREFFSFLAKRKDIGGDH